MGGGERIGISGGEIGGEGRSSSMDGRSLKNGRRGITVIKITFIRVGSGGRKSGSDVKDAS